MQYRVNPQNGDRLSILGFGCMRFVKDEKDVERQVASAIEQGVNYFDTAYIYPGNEAALGRALTKERRDKINIATKLPPYLVKRTGDAEKIFLTQLARLKTDRIDYYLIHMLPDVGEWERLARCGLLEWIAQKKASGEIRNIGFSYHGGREEFKRLIDAYSWGFCMLQYNYLDEYNQAGREGLQYASEKGLPVMVMEPLRGGRLANLPKEAASAWNDAPAKRSSAEWALRWVWNHPQVTTVLSGMNTQAMLDENIRAASDARAESLTEPELAMFTAAKAVLTQKTRVACTGCGYCIPCPRGVDIPLCFSCYNDMETESSFRARFNYVLRTHNHNASLCSECGACEARCPQHIAIRKELARAAKELERFPYRPMRFALRKVMRRSS